MKKSDVIFEKAQILDLDEILSLVNITNKEWYSKIIPKEHYQEPFLTKEQLDNMSTFMDFFVHRVDGEIVAVGSFSIRDEEIAWIPLMTVRSDFQRRGIGSELMLYLENLAKEQGFSNIQLETDSMADWALNFYTKHGYSVFKKEKNPWGHHVWLEKPLK
ncbi:MAG: GNAT family N-acetyltransferase [Candidatus Thorarchaeota archaeon]